MRVLRTLGWRFLISFVVANFGLIFTTDNIRKANMPNLTLDADVIEDKETLGGGGNQRVWDSGVYNAFIEMATIEESSGGATAVNVTIKAADKDAKLFPVSDTFWVTSGKAKGQKTFYVDQQGKKKPLPGFTAANRMCQAAADATLDAIASKGEKKMINVWDYTAGKEVPTEKFVLTELVGKPVKVDVQKFKRNKRAKDASGEYVDIADTYETNEFRYFAEAATGLSVGEKADGITEATFMNEWHAKNVGQVIDQTNKDLKPAATSAAPAQSASVFG